MGHPVPDYPGTIQAEWWDHSSQWEAHQEPRTMSPTTPCRLKVLLSTQAEASLWDTRGSRLGDYIKLIMRYFKGILGMCETL